MKELSPWNRVLEKLKCLVAVKKFPTFYRIRRLIIVITRAYHSHWCLFWARLVIATPSSPLFCRIRFNVILPSFHALPSSLFPLKPYMHLYTHNVRVTCLMNLIFFAFIILFIMQFSPVLCFFLPCRSTYFPQHCVLECPQPVLIL
jgi:hypothetical protein